MFNPDGEMTISKSKATLKQKLQVTVSERYCPVQNTIIYDISALLWIINWSLDELHVYVDAFKKFVFQALQRANVTLVFNRYFPNSIKTFTRMQRAGSNRAHKLTPDMPSPAKQQVITNTKNKIQLNAMLAEGLSNLHFYNIVTQKHSLVIAGVGDVPV